MIDNVSAMGTMRLVEEFDRAFNYQTSKFITFDMGVDLSYNENGTS